MLCKTLKLMTMLDNSHRHVLLHLFVSIAALYLFFFLVSGKYPRT